MRKPTVFEMLGLIGTFGGVAVALYIYQVSKREREPIFYVDVVRSEIVRQDRMSQAPIKILKADGTPVTSDLTALTFYFWNNGKLPIKTQDILRPLHIGFKNTKIEILDFRWLKISRDITQLKMEREPGLSHSLKLDLKILEENDGGVGQIIFQGWRDTLFAIDGDIEGVKEFKGIEERVTYLTAILAAAGGILAALVSLHLVRSLPRMKLRKQQSAVEDLLINVVLRIAILVLLILGMGQYLIERFLVPAPTVKIPATILPKK